MALNEGSYLTGKHHDWKAQQIEQGQSWECHGCCQWKPR